MFQSFSHLDLPRMFKNFSFFLLSFFTLISTPLANSETKTVAPSSSVVLSADDACNLPAPASFYVLSVGTNYITVAWSPVPGAAQYRMKVRDLTASVDVSDQLVGSLVFTQNGLMADTIMNSGFFRFVLQASKVRPSRLEQSTIVISLVLEAFNFNSTSQFNCHGGFSSIRSPVISITRRVTNSGWVRHTTMNQRARYRARSSSGHVSIGLVSPVSGNYQLLNALETRNEEGLSPLTQNDIVPSSQVFVNAWGGNACSLTMSVNGTT